MVDFESMSPQDLVKAHTDFDRAISSAREVMSFGGFLGLGQDYHPIPWDALRYDTGLGGYQTNITEDQLRNAPARSENWYRDREWEAHARPLWGALLLDVMKAVPAAGCVPGG